MKPTTVINAIVICMFLFYINSLQSQEIEKQKIYLLFVENDGASHSSLGKKFFNSNGVNFNLYQHYFLHKKGFKKEAYPKENLECFSIIEEDEIKNLEKEWREKAHVILNKKYKGRYPPYDRNFIFESYIIEKKNDSLIVYEVIFRNEGVKK